MRRDPKYGSELVDYSQWHSRLKARGFENVWHARDTYAPVTDLWSRNLRHSAWRRRRVGREPVDECRAHFMRTRRPESELSCLPLIS